MTIDHIIFFFCILDDMKKSLYTSAAQIKLLADVPEQVHGRSWTPRHNETRGLWIILFNPVTHRMLL